MATLLAPYNTAMQLGTGFNSFTQQLCIDNAVVSDPEHKKWSAVEPEEKQIPQSVTYKTSVVDKVTDVTSAMNINAAFAIKYDTFNADGKGDFINTSKIKESDASFLISVKVVNQVVYDHSLTKFHAISGLKTSNFTDVYGDSFIAGFQEGGEFTAVISVKGKDKTQSDMIKADAAISFTKDKLDLKASGTFGKDSTDFLKENETTISVSWSGGGQHLKPSDQDWTFETMKAAALKFPELVAKTPLRTYAILTKYTALRSFHATNIQVTLPYFEKAGVYTAILQEAYLDYKTIAKNLQVLAYDASARIQTLEQSPIAADVAKQATKTTTEAASQENPVAAEDSTELKVPEPEEDGVVSLSSSVNGGATDETLAMAMTPLRIHEPYPPTIQGLEAARTDCRYMLNRIVAEVDAVSRNPDIATDEKRRLPYMSPFLFKELIPVGKPVVSADAAVVDTTGMAKMGGAMRF